MVELEGTKKEQATQLWELLKNGSLTKEDLVEVFPVVKDVIHELLDCVKNELQNNKEAHLACMEVYKTIASGLTEILKREESTPEDRERASNKLLELANIVKEENENYQKQNNERIDKYLKIGFGILGVILLVLISKKTDK